jgi:CHAT domain-containing protein
MTGLSRHSVGPYRRLMRILSFLVLSMMMWVGAAFAQTEEGAEESAPPPPEMSAKDRSAAAQAALDAQVLALRQQLQTTTDGLERLRLWNEMSDAYFKASRVAESMKIGDEVVEDSKISSGRRSLRASSLAVSWALQGDATRSQRYINRAKALARDAKPEEVDELSREPAYAFLHAEAEIARRFENRHDLALLKTREVSDLAWANFNNPALSEKRHRAAANELLNIVQLHVRVLVMNNRRDEAMSFVNEIQQRIATTDLKPSGTQAAAIGEAAAIALASQDDYDGALAAVDASIAAFTRLKVPEIYPGLNSALRMRLMVALAMGTIRNYGADADQLRRGRAGSAVVAGSFAVEESDSLAFATRGQWVEAAGRIGEEVAKNTRRQGAESPFVKYPAAMQLLFMLNDPAKPATQSDIERFVSTLANDNADWADASYRGAYVEDGALSASMNALMPAGAAASDSAVALAFRISELLRSSSSQGALADGASKLAASNPKLRSLIEQEQALRLDRNLSRRTFAQSFERADRMAKQSADEIVAKRQAADVADKQKTFDANNGKLKQLRLEITAQFPVYRELVSPSIPSAAKIGAVLRPGEVYLNLYSGTTNGYAFVVQPGGKLVGVRLDMPRARTKALIVALRKPFDSASPPEREGDLGGFDLAASSALYAAWIAPLKDQLQGANTVYISAGGPLSSLPWNVLVTQQAKTLADAQWWVSQVATVQMPSASSLVLARAQTPRPAKRPFIAFADPSFDGRDTPAAPVTGTRGVRAAALPGAAASATTTAPNTADPGVDYKKLNRLPETFDEARAIGATLNASDDSVIRGQAASRSRVMKENLSDVRVVEFATHGLLPGELPGMLRAGLALAYEGQGLADSVLTIDDIVGLRLDADWVILSACNTGFASGAGGDSMSALARGFFAAGTRTVMATQWAVESQSAKELTVGVFKTLGADTKISKADALATTQRAMISGKYGAMYKHPYFWAPYFISGDAAR